MSDIGSCRVIDLIASHPIYGGHEEKMFSSLQ